MHVLNPGLLGGAHRVPRNASRARSSATSDDDATEQLRRLTGPFILRRLKTDRSIIDDLPDKIEQTERCQLTREQATLYQAVVDELLEAVVESERSARRRRSGDRHGRRRRDGPSLAVLAGMASSSRSATTRRTSCATARRSPGAPASSTRVEELLDEIVDAGDKVLCFTQFAEWGDLLVGAPRRGATAASRCGCTAASAAADATRWSAQFQQPGRAADLPALAEGRRHGAQPHRRLARDPPRPLVEPGGRGPGDRPRLPHRPAPHRARAQARVERHDRGAHRRDDRQQAGAGRAGRRHRRAVGHRAVDSTSCAR